MTNKKGIDWTLAPSKRESALDFFWSSRQWNWQTVRSLLLGLLAISLVMFIVYRGFFGNIGTRTERAATLGLLLSYALFRFPLGGEKPAQKFNWLSGIDLFFILLAAATQVYTIWGDEVSGTRNLTFTIFAQTIRVDYIVGAITILLVFEATRRSFGWVMIILSLFFVVYSLTAIYWPGELRGASTTWRYFLELLYCTCDGVYGIGLDVLLSMLFLYLLFGSLLISTKTGCFFTSAAFSAVGGYSGGPAKAAVVGSALIGMVSGSAIANVATTGSVTIPMMKSIGYQPWFAGAVEACASSGGQFMPPIMGASAFLISAFTGVSYWRVCIYAAIPATLYFLGVFLQVHFRAQKLRLSGMPKSELPDIKRVMVEGGHLMIPLVLIIILLAMGYSVTMAAVVAIISIILLSFVRKETRQSPGSLLIGLEQGTDSTIGINMCVVTVGIIAGAISATGLGVRLSLIVEALSGGNLIVGLLLSALVCLILGMAINPVLIYLIAYIFMIPGIIEMGAPVMAAHLFAFLFAASAMITPPVALAAFAAASIAGSPPMRTGLEACKLGFAGYVVPFMFVLHPSLLLLGGAAPVQSVLDLLTTVIGIFCCAAAFEGWLLRRAVVYERLLLMAGGVFLIAPSLWLGLAGLGLLGCAGLSQRLRPGDAG